VVLAGLAVHVLGVVFEQLGRPPTEPEDADEGGLHVPALQVAEVRAALGAVGDARHGEVVQQDGDLLVRQRLEPVAAAVGGRLGPGLEGEVVLQGEVVSHLRRLGGRRRRRRGGLRGHDDS
jgi:hypothetical protein